MYHQGRITKRYCTDVGAASELHPSAYGRRNVHMAGRQKSASRTQVAKALSVLRFEALPYGQGAGSLSVCCFPK